MRNTRLLYGIGIIAIIGILVGFVGYTFPTKTLTQQALKEETTANKPKMTTEGTDASVTTATKLKSCDCCAERRARLEKQRQQARARKLAKEEDVKAASP